MNQTKYETGAVRDIKDGKGRCDLMPIDVMASLMEGYGRYAELIGRFIDTGNANELMTCIKEFCNDHYKGVSDAMLDVAKHFENGAKHYGENNWKKGIPVNSYIDSALRHLLKLTRGDTDEPHDRAFVWNLMCCVWEIWHHKNPRCVEASCYYNNDLRCTAETGQPENGELCINYKED